MEYKDVKKLVSYAKRYYPELKEYKIKIIYGDSFSCTMKYNKPNCIITYSNNYNYFKYDILPYLKEQYQIDKIENINHFDFIFCLLHEIGHIIYFNKVEVSRVKLNGSFEENYREYRKLPQEKACDEFAIDFITRHKRTIEKYFG